MLEISSYWNNQSHRRGGESIVQISLVAMALQTLVLHIPFRIIAWNPQHRNANHCNSIGRWLRLSLCLLLDMVLLFVRDAFGCFMLGTRHSSIFYYLGPMLLCTLLLHHWQHYKQVHPRNAHLACQEFDNIVTGNRIAGSNQETWRHGRNLIVAESIKDTRRM